MKPCIARLLRRALAGARATVAVQLAALAVPAAAVDLAPSTLPQVRVVQDMHTAPIDQIRADARFERLVTTSSDKTIRIWRLSDFGLLRTVALPSEPGREGTPYAVAISADGQRIYAAGYTGFDWRHASHIYVIDAATGRILGALGRFDDDVITSLDLSADNARLAVGLGRGGLVVIEPKSGARLFADPKYAGPVTFVHHAADGRLASSSSDGCLRVYAADGTLLRRNQYPPVPADRPQCTGGELGGVRFSPDGKWLAVGTRFLPQVGVFDGQTLALQRTIQATDANQRSLCCIAWSHDSRTLFVNGSFQGDQPTPLYVIHDPATGALQRWNVGRQQFVNMLPMPDGSLVFATTTPSLTRLGADGRVLARPDGRPLSAEPDNVDFFRSRGNPEGLLVSADASVVAFDIAPGRRVTVSPLSHDAEGVLSFEAASAARLHGAAQAGALRVQADTSDLGYRQPVLVNGAAVALALEEGVRSWAVHSRLRVAALGTQWRILLVDDHGRPAPGWEVPPFVPAPVHHTVISDDGRWVVVAIGDGTLHWYEVATGRERMAMFVHANGVDWVAWRPDGYYASSPQGDRYVGWIIDRSFAQSPDFFRAVQFERRLYRPDLVQAALGDRSMGDASARQLAQTLLDLAPPRVTIDSVAPTAESGMVAIQFSVEATGRPIRDIGVYVGGLPVLPTAQRNVTGNEVRRVSRAIVVRETEASAQVRVEAATDVSLGVDETRPLQAIPRAPGGRSGTLWVLAIGVEKFDNLPDLRQLPLATSDAHGLAQALLRQKGRAFADVRVALLTEDSDLRPTKANILSQLRKLEQMAPEDTVVVLMSSHGTANGAEYFVVTKDITAADTQALVEAEHSMAPLPGSAVPSALSGSDLTSALARLPGRRILILDTCHAGAQGSTNPYALIKRSASADLALVLASHGDELAFDSLTRHNSVFTGALIDVLARHETAISGTLTLRQAFDATLAQVQAEVQEIRRHGNPTARQTPMLSASTVLGQTALGAP